MEGYVTVFDPIRRSIELTRARPGSAASGIFAASLYRYATKGDPGPMFRAETLSRAFRPMSGGASGFGQVR